MEIIGGFFYAFNNNGGYYEEDSYRSSTNYTWHGCRTNSTEAHATTFKIRMDYYRWWSSRGER